MSQKIRSDPSKREAVARSCKAHKGTMVILPGGQYKCAGVLDATIDLDIGDKNYEETGSPSRLKHSWLDKHIEEQKEQRKALQKVAGGSDPAELQEMAELYGWD